MDHLQRIHIDLCVDLLYASASIVRISHCFVNRFLSFFGFLVVMSIPIYLFTYLAYTSAFFGSLNCYSHCSKIIDA